MTHVKMSACDGGCVRRSIVYVCSNVRPAARADHQKGQPKKTTERKKPIFEKSVWCAL